MFFSSTRSSGLGRHFVLPFMVLTHTGASFIRALLFGFTLMAIGATAPKVDSVNTFDAPNTVVPKPASTKIQGGKLALKLEPKSVTVVSVEQ